MNESSGSNNFGVSDMDDVGRLINLAGARETVEKERFERVHQNVQQHWRHVQNEKRTETYSRRFRITAIAASLALVVGVVFVLLKAPFEPGMDSLARIERVLGEVKIAGDPVSTGAAIHANTTIITGKDSRIALRMSQGQSLRIDSASRVVVHSPNHLYLDSGAIYVDTALAPGQSAMQITTPLGTATDIGTQFQVRMNGMVMVVGVRRGLVEVSQKDQPKLAVNRGYFVELDVNGDGEAQALETNDPDWDWIETIIPEFDIQGATLAQYLQWYSNERAMGLLWADNQSKNKARKITLAGSITGSSLDEGLLLVKQIAPFEFLVSPEGFWVKVE